MVLTGQESALRRVDRALCLVRYLHCAMAGLGHIHTRDRQKVAFADLKPEAPLVAFATREPRFGEHCTQQPFLLLPVHDIDGENIHECSGICDKTIDHDVPSGLCQGDRSAYDPESRMLRGFLAALPAHLEPGGEGWLILSDLAELLGLRPRSELLSAFEAAGLQVVDRSDVRPTHPRASDETDPLHAARAAEVTSLWRLAGR